MASLGEVNVMGVVIRFDGDRSVADQRGVFNVSVTIFFL